MSAFGLGLLLAGAGLLLLLLALHPFTTYPLTLAALMRLCPRPIRPGTPPASAALCVCAYNEEGVIGAKADNMLAMRQAMPGLELLAYVDAATDRTAELLSQYDGIRVVSATTRQGKTHGMNVLAAMASADVLVFSDANVMFDPDAVPRLLAPFSDPDVGAVCGHLLYTSADGGATAAAGSAYWRLEERIKSLESETGSAMGADGSIFAIRRALHCPPPPDLIDDMYVSLSVLCQGARVVRAHDALAFEEAVSRPSEEFRRKVRISCQAMNVHRALWPRLRRLPALDLYKYVSHKLLRWLTIYLLAAGAASFLAGVALAGAPGVAGALFLAGLAGLAAILTVPAGPLPALRDVLAAFVATGIGVWRSVRGDRFQTWNPPASARVPAPLATLDAR